MDGFKRILRGMFRAIKRFIKRTRRFFSRLTLRGRAVIFGGSALIIAAITLIAVLGGPKEDAAALELDVRAATEASAQTDQAVIAIDAPTPPPTPVPTPTPTPDPTLKYGMTDARVLDLQVRLMDLGYLDLDEPTDYYGPATRASVKKFQRQINFIEDGTVKLDEDGVAGIQTLELLYGDDAPKCIVKYGMSGDDITEMQVQLKDLGYISATTGYFGDKTVTAIKDFQSRNSLSADGLAGEKTFELLYSDSAKESASKAHQARTKANIDTMISFAKSMLGVKYVSGGTKKTGVDCSGLVYYCLSNAGSNRRRLNAAGYSRVEDWEKLTSINSLKKGDLIFFYNNAFSKVGHVGIIVSSSEMIDASSSNGKVVRRSFTTSYWQKHFVCGRRPW